MSKTMGVAAVLVVSVAALFGMEGALWMWVLAPLVGAGLSLVAKGARFNVGGVWVGEPARLEGVGWEFNPLISMPLWSPPSLTQPNARITLTLLPSSCTLFLLMLVS